MTALKKGQLEKKKQRKESLIKNKRQKGKEV